MTLPTPLYPEAPMIAPVPLFPRRPRPVLASKVITKDDLRSLAEADDIPEEFTDEDVRRKHNSLADKLKRIATCAALFASLSSSAASPTVKYARKGDVPNVSNVVVSVTGDFPTESDVSAAVSEFARTNVYPAIAAATNGIRSVDGAARPLPKYLHLLDFDDCYADDAAWYYAQRNAESGGCSAVRDGGFLYRNFDFPLDGRAEFVVRVKAGPGRFASVGVAQVGTNLTEDAVTSGRWSRYYKCLPGATVDGVNSEGVVAEINVVDGAPAWRSGGDIHPLAAVRWALDNGTSASAAASNLAERVAFPAGWTQNFHYMVSDERETWIVENGTNYLVSGRAVMTNFRLYPAHSDGEGQERYSLLVGGASVTNAWYTRAYSRDTDWASEFGDPPMDAVKDAWERLGTKEARRATGAFWQTVHTSVYDITNRTLRVAVQETDDWYSFSVPSAGGVKSVNGMTGDVVIPGFVPDPEDEAFSNAVLRVALNADFGGEGEFPPGGKTTVGGFLAALAAAVVWLKRNKYQKPSGGIPKADLEQAVRTSLANADTALQSHQSIKTINGESITGSGNIEISGGWKNNGTIEFTDEEISFYLRSGAVIRNYQSGEYGYYGSLYIPEDAEELDFLVEIDVWAPFESWNREYSIEFSDTLTTQYGTVYYGSVTLYELISETMNRVGISPAPYLTRVRIIKSESGYFAEVV